MDILISRELESGHVLPASGRLLQSPFWGAFKASFGWQARWFDLSGRALLVLLRRFKPGFSLAYIPHAPDTAGIGNAGDYLARCGADLAGLLPRHCLFARFDLPAEADSALMHSLAARKGLEKAPVDIQPPDTVVVPLDPEEDAIMGAMKSKTRYNIRLSGKKGVVITEGSKNDLDDWYALYEETGRRDRIALHSRAYFETLFELAETFGREAPVVRLLFAEVESRRIAAIIVSRYGETSTYMYGASSNLHRNLMPAYGLQWYAMRTEKAAGSRFYDLFGIPPADDPSHPMHGLYRFKTGFGGAILRRPGCWDVPFRPALYRAYRHAEGVRNYYYKVFRKK